jgi:hypothetical protein
LRTKDEGPKSLDLKGRDWAVQKYRREIAANCGPFSTVSKKVGKARLGGGDHLDQTANSPRSHRTSLRNSSQERNFLLQRPRGEMPSFGSIAGAETALTREFGRHAFETAARLRVSRTLYNFRVCVVGATGIEPVTPSMSTRCSPAELRALRLVVAGWVRISAPKRAGKDAWRDFGRRIKPPASCSLR